MRPYSTLLQEIVHTFEAKNACLYRIPEGGVEQTDYGPTQPADRFDA